MLSDQPVRVLLVKVCLPNVTVRRLKPKLLPKKSLIEVKRHRSKGMERVTQRHGLAANDKATQMHEREYG